MIFFFPCISHITVFWGKPANLPALKKTPLQRCTYCTLCSAPSPVEGGGGLVCSGELVLPEAGLVGSSCAPLGQSLHPPQRAACLHRPSPSVRLASCGDAWRNLLLPGQRDHHRGEYGGLPHPRELWEGLDLFTWLIDWWSSSNDINLVSSPCLSLDWTLRKYWPLCSAARTVCFPAHTSAPSRDKRGAIWFESIITVL